MNKVTKWFASMCVLAVLSISVSVHAIVFDISFDANEGQGIDGTGVFAVNEDGFITTFTWGFGDSFAGGLNTDHEHFTNGGGDFLRDLMLRQGVGGVSFASLPNPLIYGNLFPAYFVAGTFTGPLSYLFQDLQGDTLSRGELTLTERMTPVPIPAAFVPFLISTLLFRVWSSRGEK